MSDLPSAIDDLRYLAAIRLSDALAGYIESSGRAQDVLNRWRFRNMDELRRSLRASMHHCMSSVVAKAYSIMEAKELYNALTALIALDDIRAAFPDIDRYLEVPYRQFVEYIHEDVYQKIVGMEFADAMERFVKYAKSQAGQIRRLDTERRCNLFAALIYAVGIGAAQYRTELTSVLLSILTSNPELPSVCARHFERRRRQSLRALVSGLAVYGRQLANVLTDKELMQAMPNEVVARIASVAADIASAVSQLLPQAVRTPAPEVPKLEEKPERAVVSISAACGEDVACKNAVEALVKFFESVAASREPVFDMLRALLSRPSSRRFATSLLTMALRLDQGMRRYGCDSVSFENDDIAVRCRAGHGVKLTKSGPNAEIRAVVGAKETEASQTITGLGFLFENRYGYGYESFSHLTVFLYAFAETRPQDRADIPSEAEFSDMFTSVIMSMMPDAAGRNTPAFKVLRMANSAVFVPSTPVGYFICSRKLRSVPVAEGEALVGVACGVPGFLVLSERPGEFIPESMAVEIAYNVAHNIPEYVERYKDRVVQAQLNMYVIGFSKRYIAGFNMQLPQDVQDKVSQHTPTKFVDFVAEQLTSGVEGTMYVYRPTVLVGTPSDLVRQLEEFRRTYIATVQAVEPTLMPFPTVQTLEEIAEVSRMITTARPYTFRERANIVRELHEAQSEYERKAEEFRAMARAGILRPEEAQEYIKDIVRARLRVENIAKRLAAHEARGAVQDILRRLIAEQVEAPFAPVEEYYVPTPEFDRVDNVVRDRIRRMFVPVMNDSHLGHDLMMLTEMLSIISASNVHAYCDEMYNQYIQYRQNRTAQYPHLVGFMEFLCSAPSERFNTLDLLVGHLSVYRDRYVTDTAKRLAALFISISDYIKRRGQIHPRLPQILGTLRALNDMACYCWRAQD